MSLNSSHTARPEMADLWKHLFSLRDALNKLEIDDVMGRTGRDRLPEVADALDKHQVFVQALFQRFGRPS